MKTLLISLYDFPYYYSFAIIENNKVIYKIDSIHDEGEDDFCNRIVALLKEDDYYNLLIKFGKENGFDNIYFCPDGEFEEIVCNQK